MIEEISKLKDEALEKIMSAAGELQLEEIRVSLLGKKGSVSSLMRGLGEMDATERSRLGPALNGLKNEISNLITQKKNVQ